MNDEVEASDSQSNAGGVDDDTSSPQSKADKGNVNEVSRNHAVQMYLLYVCACRLPCTCPPPRIYSTDIFVHVISRVHARPGIYSTDILVTCTCVYVYINVCVISMCVCIHIYMYKYILL